MCALHSNAAADILPILDDITGVAAVFSGELHYGVWWSWPRIGARAAAIWDVKAVAAGAHSRGFPKLVAAILVFG